jgi:hypothetical protein
MIVQQQVGGMLTVIMECKDQEAAIAQTLASLVSGAVQGLVADVILVDQGSSDDTAALADAVGCRFVENTPLAEVISTARGQWILVLEPGARLMASSWYDEIPDFIGLGVGPARFRPSHFYSMPIWKRIFRRTNPLELGLLISKADIFRGAELGLTLREIAVTARTRKLMAEIIPAWVYAATASDKAKIGSIANEASSAAL